MKHTVYVVGIRAGRPCTAGMTAELVRCWTAATALLDTLHIGLIKEEYLIKSC